ncbi:tRNA (N6-isopentenyl adenosine(37)-C2)-methylthiotransferase MiaB [Candidatus Sumerlaeota bacterium]|nr:tRNA (N6-isopentenyl adenosine(37)-C2)-methylthiotransferase MiaB [Candidatus Sumerlaeota bacterium]
MLLAEKHLKYCLITYGCQMNDADSEALAGELSARGWQRAEQEQEADLVLVNTCVVRRSAEQRALGRVWQLAPLKHKRPKMIVGIVGCLAQKDGEALLEEMPHVDLVVGTRALPGIPVLLEELRHTRRRLVSVDGMDRPVVFDAEPLRENRIKAMVTIIYGCNNDCSYCIVPQTRGREWSRRADDIVAEVARLAKRGWREVTLLGQNVNSYNDGCCDFPDLLRRIASETGIERIRYVTSHPKDLSDRLIETVAGAASICENFHVPAQAGSDRILERMSRGYGRGDYLRLVERIRRAIPDAAITTDLMVGFPGETDDEFAQTLDLARAVRWDSAFMYMYSVRDGTPAAQLPDDVPIEVKKRRLQQLIKLQEKISAEINEQLTGSRQEVLVEGLSRRSAEKLMGRTRGDKVVVFAGSPELIGQTVRVMITAASAYTLFGELRNSG